MAPQAQAGNFEVASHVAPAVGAFAMDPSDDRSKKQHLDHSDAEDNQDDLQEFDWVDQAHTEKSL